MGPGEAPLPNKLTCIKPFKHNSRAMTMTMSLIGWTIGVESVIVFDSFMSSDKIDAKLAKRNTKGATGDRESENSAHARSVKEREGWREREKERGR